MSRMAFIFRTDVHVADKSPASWKGDYRAEVLGSLRQIGVLALKYTASAVLDGGDFFHVKSATRNSHELMVAVIKLHGEYPCPTYSIEGNHDIVGNNLGTLDQQPLGVLYAGGTFRHLREQVFEVEGLRVRVVGLPYDKTRDVRAIQEVRKQPGDDYLVAIVHALAAEDPPDSVEDFFGEPVFRYRDLVFDGGPDVFCFGHWHKDQGIVRIDGRHFVNQGAVSRGALIRENTERTPKVTLIEFTRTSLTTTEIPLDVAPAHEVFDLERKERQEREAVVIQQFIDQIQEDLQADPQDVEASVEKLEYAPEVRARALAYLERARAN